MTSSEDECQESVETRTEWSRSILVADVDQPAEVLAIMTASAFTESR